MSFSIAKYVSDKSNFFIHSLLVDPTFQPTSHVLQLFFTIFIPYLCLDLTKYSSIVHV